MYRNAALIFFLILGLPAIAEAQKTCTPTSATSQNCIVTLTWQITGVDATHPAPTSVQVRRSDAGGPMAIIGTVATPTSSMQNTFTDSGNVAHCWDATGMLAGVASATSPKECWTSPAIAVTPPVPAGPVGLTIAAISSSSFRITWADIEGETGYDIEGKESRGNALFAQVAHLQPDIVTYDWTGRKKYTPYCVRVKASNPGAPYSPISCATTSK